METRLKDKDLRLKTEISNINDISQNTGLTKNNDQSWTKEEEDDMVYDEPIEYKSSPRIGLVSINFSRNKKNNYIQLTENTKDITNTISLYVKRLQLELEKDPNENNGKIDVNFFNKKQETHIKPEKKEEKLPILIDSHSTVNNIMIDKNSELSFKSSKRINEKKRLTKKLDKVKNLKKWEKYEKPKEKEKMFKKKRTSFSISAMYEKLNRINNNLTKHNELFEKPKEEIKEKIRDNSLSKTKDISKTKIIKENEDITPNIIIYGSESSSEIFTKSKKEGKSINKNKGSYFKKEKHNYISSGNDNNDEDNTQTKITRPSHKQSTDVLYKIKIKHLKKKKSQMERKFTSNNITYTIKLPNKYSSANVQEKNKDKRKLSVLKRLTTKHLFKEDKETNNKIKHRNSLSKHLVSTPKSNHLDLKKSYVKSSKDMKKSKKMVRTKSRMSINPEKIEHLKKKSNNNLRHYELEKSFVKRQSYNSNTHIPRITLNTKTKENDTNEIHLVVKGKEETIINYTNQQMIEDEKDYMIDCLKILAKLKNKEVPRCKQKVNFHFPPEEKQKKIALFDLDETLVHCTNNSEPGMDGDVVSIKLPTNKTVKVGLNIRKNWKNAFDLIMNHYHVVIYTASHPSYADAVLDYLDKDKKYFKYRLYRSHCVQCDVDGFKFYVKDLDTLDEHYNLKDIVIIDNSILSFAYHLYNGIPIVPFINQQNDTELMFTAHYLTSIANYDDLSLENKKHLNLDNLLSMAKILNEIEDNEEEEEDEGKIYLIKINKESKEDEDKGEDKIKLDEEEKEDLTKKESGKNNGDKEKKKENKDENNEIRKFRGRPSVKQSRKTINITEDMKKNLDEMMKKKKEELEKIDED